MQCGAVEAAGSCAASPACPRCRRSASRKPPVSSIVPLFGPGLEGMQHVMIEARGELNALPLATFLLGSEGEHTELFVSPYRGGLDAKDKSEHMTLIAATQFDSNLGGRLPGLDAAPPAAPPPSESHRLARGARHRQGRRCPGHDLRHSSLRRTRDSLARRHWTCGGPRSGGCRARWPVRRWLLALRRPTRRRWSCSPLAVPASSTSRERFSRDSLVKRPCWRAPVRWSAHPGMSTPRPPLFG